MVLYLEYTAVSKSEIIIIIYIVYNYHNLTVNMALTPTSVNSAIQLTRNRFNSHHRYQNPSIKKSLENQSSI